MRGKEIRAALCSLDAGITPAYAGKRSDKKQMHHTLQDHPRLCGEKFPQFYFSQTVYRITPAYAGKSEITDEGSSIRRDHPRLCGEKTVLASRFFRVWGSPPPMRGKVVNLITCFHFFRITPAYAGKSVCFWRLLVEF